MSLQSKIENKLNDALKSKDKATYSTLRLVVAAIKDQIIAKKIKDKNNLPDPDLVALLKKMVKQRNDSCDAYKKAGREDLLKKELPNTSIISVSHKLSSVAKFSDHILVLDKGYLVEQGSHEDLIKKNKFYANLISSQIKNYE